MSGKDFIRLDLPPVHYRVDGLIADGLTVLASKTKMGKSWLAIQMALSVAAGRPFLGMQTEQCMTAYFDLETGPALSQDRLKKILAGRNIPAGYLHATDARKLGDGFEDDLRAVKMAYPKLGLVIIDTLAYIRRPLSKGKSEYDAANQIMGSLKTLADELHIAIVVITHTRKSASPAAPVDSVIGSTAWVSRGDNVIVLSRYHEKDRETYIDVSGRSVSPYSGVIIFDPDTCVWQAKGSREDYGYTKGLQEYRTDPYVQVIRYLLSDKPVWQGTPAEYIAAASSNKVSLGNVNPKSVGLHLNKISQVLEIYDGIIFTKKRTPSSPMWIFSRLEKH